MKLHLYPLKLVLRHVFRTSKVTRKIQPTLIVGLEEESQIGYGECTENVFFGMHLADLVAEIEEKRAFLGAIPRTCSPEDLHAQLKLGNMSSFSLCALDEAMHDLRAKQVNEPLYAQWGLKPKSLLSSYTIGLDTVESMRQKIHEKPWPIYKIKLGKEDDIALIRALRASTDAPFRVDANGAWGLEESIEKSKALKDLGVEFIEQPLSKDSKEEQKQLYKASALPVMADESCEHEQDLMDCVGHFHGINIKLTKCGGLTAARRMIVAAKAHGLSCMMGCMVESSVGISAIAHLVPLLDYVDMDGALLLAEDPAEGVTLTAHGVRYSERPGTGASLKPEYLCQQK